MKYLLITMFVLLGCKVEAQSVLWRSLDYMTHLNLPEKDTCYGLVLVSDTCHFTVPHAFTRKVFIIRKRFDPLDGSPYMSNNEILLAGFYPLPSCFVVWSVMLVNPRKY
jgi:hypothetical protein